MTSIVLSVPPPPALAVDLAPLVPSLELDIRPPQPLDAQLLPVLVGPPGASSDLTHTHQQSTAADEWLVNHGLGKYPSVTVVDSAGDQVEGDVAYIDSNSLRISFSAAFAGRAYLN